MTGLARGVRAAIARTGATSTREFCDFAGVNYGTICDWLRRDEEPRWLRTLRTLRRVTGMGYGELGDEARELGVIK